MKLKLKQGNAGRRIIAIYQKCHKCDSVQEEKMKKKIIKTVRMLKNCKIRSVASIKWKIFLWMWFVYGKTVRFVQRVKIASVLDYWKDAVWFNIQR